jgi:hypothetical protein
MEPLSTLEDLTEMLRVGKLAEVDGIFEPVEPARGRSSRDAEQVPAGAPAALEHDVTPLEVDLGHSRTQQELDPQLAILVSRTQAQAVSLHRSEQEAFGKVRPLIREHRLRAGEQDLALKAGVPQARGGGVPGRTTADDYCFLDSSRTRNSDQVR